MEIASLAALLLIVIERSFLKQSMCVMVSLRSKSLALCNFRFLKCFLTALPFKKYHQHVNQKAVYPT